MKFILRKVKNHTENFEENFSKEAEIIKILTLLQNWYVKITIWIVLMFEKYVEMKFSERIFSFLRCASKVYRLSIANLLFK